MRDIVAFIAIGNIGYFVAEAQVMVALDERQIDVSEHSGQDG